MAYDTERTRPSSNKPLTDNQFAYLSNLMRTQKDWEKKHPGISVFIDDRYDEIDKGIRPDLFIVPSHSVFRDLEYAGFFRSKVCFPHIVVCAGKTASIPRDLLRATAMRFDWRRSDSGLTVMDEAQAEDGFGAFAWRPGFDFVADAPRPWLCAIAQRYVYEMHDRILEAIATKTKSGWLFDIMDCEWTALRWASALQQDFANRDDAPYDMTKDPDLLSMLFDPVGLTDPGAYSIGYKIDGEDSEPHVRFRYSNVFYKESDAILRLQKTYHDVAVWAHALMRSDNEIAPLEPNGNDGPNGHDYDLNRKVIRFLQKNCIGQMRHVFVRRAQNAPIWHPYSSLLERP